MADIAVLIPAEQPKLSETITVPTRVYFPSGTVPIDTPTIAFDAAWVNTGTAVRRKLVTDARKRGTAAASITVTGAAANPELALHAQYVSKPLRKQTLSGNIRGQFRALESAAGANATIQIGIRVVSQDGQTVRATLLAVGGTTTTSTTPPEFTTALTNRRLLTAGDATPLGLTSYDCADGDRLVIEIGHNNKSISTSQTHGLSFGDNTVDLLTDDTTTTAQDPWIEFDTTIRFQDAVEQVRISGSGVVERMDRGWIRIADWPVQAAIFAGLARSVPDETIEITDTLSAARDLTASLQEDVKVTDGPLLATGAFLVNLTDSLRVLEQAGQTLDPEQAFAAESLTITDTVQADVLFLVTLQESLRVIDVGQGVTQLLGVLHVTDTVAAALVVAGGLATHISDETITITESLLLSRDLTVTPTESLKVADAVTVSRDHTVTLTEPLKLADTPIGALDPVERSVTDALTITDTVSATFGLELTVTSESLRLADTASGRLDPIQVSVDSEALRIADTDLAQARTLEVLVTGEALTIADTLTSQSALGAVAGPEAVRLTDTLTVSLTPLLASKAEALSVTDTLAGAFLPQLAATLTPETLKVNDRVVILSVSLTETLRVIDLNQGRTSLLGVLHVVDGPVQAQVGNFLSRGVTADGLKLSDTVQATRLPLEATVSEVCKLGYTLNEVEYTRDEYSTLSEVLFVDLATPAGNLSAGLQAEDLAITESLTARRDLEVPVTVDSLKVADAVSASRDLTVVLSEAAQWIDTTPVGIRDLIASVQDSLTVFESATGRTDPLQRLVTEDGLVLRDTGLAVNIGNPADLSAGVTAERFTLLETFVTQADLTVTLAETLTLSETAGSGLRGVAARESHGGRARRRAQLGRSDAPPGPPRQ